MKNIVDSSVWLEYFLGGKLSADCLKVIDDTENLIVPAIVLYEVFRKFLTQYNETEAIQVTEQMCEGQVIEMDYYLSIFAAKVAKDWKLGMADSYIYATTLLHEAELWTLDSDFKYFPQVKFFSKRT